MSKIIIIIAQLLGNVFTRVYDKSAYLLSRFVPCCSTLLISLLFISHFAFANDVGNANSGHVSSYSHSDNSGGGDAGNLLLMVYYLFRLLPFPLNIIALVIVVFLYFRVQTSQKINRVQTSYDYNQQLMNVDPISNLKEADPLFSKYEFISYAKEAIITIEEAIEAQDITAISPFTNDAFQEKIQSIIDNQRQKSKKASYEGQEIMDVCFNSFRPALDLQNGYDKLEVELFVSEIYQLLNDEKANPLSSFSKPKRFNQVYQVIFARHHGVLTQQDKRQTTSNCPKCGAPNGISRQGICSYCHAHITTGDYGWVIIDWRTIGEQYSSYFRRYHTGSLYIHNNEENIVTQIQQVDNTFDQLVFEKYVEDAFIAVQNAWEARNMVPIRKFESDELFATHSEQIKEYINKKQQPCLENQKINDIHLNRFEQDGKNEYLIVIIDCDLNIFLQDEQGKLVSGSKTEIKTNGYRLRFKRSAGIQSSMPSITHCPNCGAPIEMTETGQCDYCHSQISNGEHGWVLDAYEGLYRFKKGFVKNGTSIADKIRLAQSQ